ncbi:hypothetical protein [Bradyrhizobium genosp. SA-3]|uniref:hypothetical protein n=1 Tax=Bradyrhizobium genosp. SA-3 TaxID=508868 RepID=UPI001FDFDF0B|nr:hypothetical protein [Bradyrhizobium genosp. SA-3]
MNGISAETFTFKAGDKAQLRSIGGVVTESSAGEKLWNTKKSPSDIKLDLVSFDTEADSQLVHKQSCG